MHADPFGDLQRLCDRDATVYSLNYGKDQAGVECILTLTRNHQSSTFSALGATKALSRRNAAALALNGWNEIFQKEE